MTVTGGASPLRSDIQALRAAAVGAVVLFHLWPDALPGGYAGVDIFFAISGYLITAHLLNEIERDGRVDLLRFWGRRLRRLLPAALTVLAASTVLVLLLLPQGVWKIHLREIIGSALYVENWLLARDSVDYLAAENAPSVAQHYWSLSVEEQFYLAWPLLLTAVIVLLPAAVSRRRKVGIGLGLVFLVSLAASVVVTATSPGPAYFVTYGRAWEFAAGGLLAAAAITTRQLSAPVATTSRVAGWGLILGSVLLLNESTPFPGWVALFPVVGTVLVIAAGDGREGSLYRRTTDLPPVQSAGTLSYGIYLWHWPLIVIGATTSPRLEGVAALAATWALAWLTYRYIETPLRFHRTLTRSIPWTYGASAVACAAVVAVAFGGIRTVDAAVAESADRADRLLADDTRCLGAESVLGADQPCVNPRLDGVLVPSIAARLDDTGGAYQCYQADEDLTVPVEPCRFGPRRGDSLRVALVGDSHAATLLPGLKDQLRVAGWTLDTFLGRGCRWTDVGDPEDRCRADRAPMTTMLEGEPYDVVLVVLRRQPLPPAGDDDPAAEALAAAWRPVIARGTAVIAVADNPWLPDETVACVDDATDADALAACSFDEADAWSTNDPLPRAVELAGRGAALVDLTRTFCADGTCPTVIGNVVVYRDSNHMTATFVRTLAPFLVSAIDDALSAVGVARD